MGQKEEEAVRCLLRYTGDDPYREGLVDTPVRVLRAYKEMFGGYEYGDEELKELAAVFEDGACDEMVIAKDIPFTSFCEHHILPFTGVAHVGYLPNRRVIGISKIARMVDVFARRLQIQERLTQQVTGCLDHLLNPLGAACVIEAKHSCTACRGIKKEFCLVTSSLTGAFKEESSTRAEFFSLVRGVG